MSWGFLCMFLLFLFNILNPGNLKQNWIGFYQSKPPECFANNASNTKTLCYLLNENICCVHGKQDQDFKEAFSCSHCFLVLRINLLVKFMALLLLSEDRASLWAGLDHPSYKQLCDPPWMYLILTKAFHSHCPEQNNFHHCCVLSWAGVWPYLLNYFETFFWVLHTDNFPFLRVLMKLEMHSQLDDTNWFKTNSQILEHFK